jgi:neopullulanase
LSDAAAPDWVEDAVFYQIFPDRFARSPVVAKPNGLEPWDSPPTQYGFKGGDLAGIAERLDYLADLGVTALYLNPIFSSTANHRYVTTDYYQVDPILGGNQAFARLLDEAHGRGMRVVLDGVFNHTSRGFFPFAHILENGPASPYLDWYNIRGFPLFAYASSRAPNYDCWWNLRALPKLNTDNPAVRQFLWAVGRHWIEQGADGWRLDVPNEIDDDAFWQEFRRRVKEANPRAYLVGEFWTPAERWLQGDQFDAVMNYVLGSACLGFFIEGGPEPMTIAGTGYSHAHALDAPAFGRAIQDLLGRYAPAVTRRQLNLAGSHDTARLLTMARNDESAVRLMLQFLMTFPGAPCIYYGDEIGMAGGRDPDCRGAFPWEQSRWRHDLRAFVKRCIALRRAHPALRTGTLVPLVADAGVYAFLRKQGDEEMVLAFNVSRGSRTLAAPMAEAASHEGSVWRDVWGAQTARVEGGVLRGLSLAPRSATVLERLRTGG